MMDEEELAAFGFSTFRLPPAACMMMFVARHRLLPPSRRPSRTKPAFEIFYDGSKPNKLSQKRFEEESF